MVTQAAYDRVHHLKAKFVIVQHLILQKTHCTLVVGMVEELYLFICLWADIESCPLLLHPFIGLLHQPWMIDGDDCGTVGGTNEWQGN
jgi:hypothetical protein